MAMLADRKQKQRWTLNPRGKLWSDDSNKFGQKILEKMGWSNGKGLGAKENGITEHIKQSYKNDSKGIGFTDKGDQWTRHETDFSSLLQNLGQDNSVPDVANEAVPMNSLEKKSQTSRRRVHYHKFTRGKDLSRCTEKDLANVFGRKTLAKQQGVEETVKMEEGVVLKQGKENKDFGVTTVHGGNMADYFKTKLKNYQSTFAKHDSEDENIGFGFGFKCSFDSTNETTDNASDTMRKTMFISGGTTKTESEGIHKLDDDFSSKSINDNTGEVVADKTDAKVKFAMEQPPKEEVRKKKKKKSKQEDECFDNFGFTDAASEEIETVQIEAPKEKKKSKKKSKESMSFDNPMLDPTDEETTIEISNPSSSYDNPAFSEKDDIEEMKIKTKKTKKRKLETIVEEIGEAEKNIVDGIQKKKCKINSEGGVILETVGIVKKVKKDKIKKKRTNGFDIADGITDDTIEEIVNIDVKKDKRNKKVKATSELDNPDNTTNGTGEETAEKESKKDKKHKKKMANIGLDNLACTANSAEQNIEETITNMTNAIDNYQLELENQLNEKKMQEGADRTQKNAQIRKSGRPMKDDTRKSVRKLLQGKVRFKFSGANLDQIVGYGVPR